VARCSASLFVVNTPIVGYSGNLHPPTTSLVALSCVVCALSLPLSGDEINDNSAGRIARNAEGNPPERISRQAAGVTTLLTRVPQKRRPVLNQLQRLRALEGFANQEGATFFADII
jgi:hypothetical protein